MYSKNKIDLFRQFAHQVFKNTFITPKARKNFGQMTQEQRDKLTSIKFDFPDS
jgi:arginyl-tRNA--protein-N-Asp/Glu arginylyltransferase